MIFELDNMFVSVKEAAELTGKSATTIYRLCNKRINTDYVLKEDNKFLIDKEFLMATYPPEEPEETVEVDEEVPEMKYENVIDESTQVASEEKPVSLENELSLNNKTTKNSEKELETGVTLEFEEQKAKPYFQQVFSKDVLVGLGVSLAAISIFIYLLFKLSN